MTYPFRQARWYQTAARSQVGDVWWIVVHCPQFPEQNDAAERLAAYFATTDRKASTHAVCDSDSLVECVRDKDVAYGAGGANRRGLHIEIAGYAEQTPQQWLDPFSSSALRVAAGWAREKAARWQIPLAWCDVGDLHAGRWGITDHATVELTWPSTGHHDPGEGFPRDHFMSLLHPTSGDDDLEALLAWT